MNTGNWVGRLEVERIFAEEIHAAGGALQEALSYREQLFLKALLPAQQEVVAGDRLQAGVALRAAGRKIRVNPYVVRLICYNGFMLARVVGTKTIEVDDDLDEELEVAATQQELRGAIRMCIGPKALAEAAAGMRRSLDEPLTRERGHLIELEWLLAGIGPKPTGGRGVLLGSFIEDVVMALEARRLAAETRDEDPPPFGANGLRQRIRKQLRREGSNTRFGLLNAVTAVAREVGNPKVQWWLEALGGAIALGWPRPRGMLRDCSFRSDFQRPQQLRKAA